MNSQRASDLFWQAIDNPPENLARWLAEQCGGDANLHMEVERMLRLDAKASHFMEKPLSMSAIAAAAANASFAADVSAAESVPFAFGVYRVLRSLGVGGMGEVWLAERSDGEFEQHVAIKQLAYPTPGLLQRFRQERQILARLEHANIARLIDGGADAAGVPYLVMEYIDGVPITDYVRAHALDLRARLDLFLGVCAGVQYAHQNLVVHRDLKPSNILITADGLPKLLDFGIAKVLATTDEAAATQTAARLLTPDYAAPEQFSGGAITTATDVYALGVVLHELLADARPARRSQIDATNRTDELPPPSAALDRATAGANARRRALRGDLDRIALTALAQEPLRRYASAEALAADIQRYLRGRPIAARGDGAWYLFRKYARRNRYVLATTAIAFAVCVAAAVVSLGQARLARDEAQRAGAVRQFLVDVFQQANPDENKGKPISAHQLLEKSERQVQQRFANQPALEADVAALLGQLYRDLGDLRRGETLLKRALAISASPGIPDDVRGRVLVNVAVQESKNGAKFADSLAHARQALPLLEAAPGKNAEDIAKAHWIIASNLLENGADQAAQTWLHETIEQDHAALGERSESLAEEYLVLGNALLRLREDGAETEFDHALAIMRGIYGENSTHVARALKAMSATYVDVSDLKRAEDLHRKILQIHLDTLGPEHPDTLTAQGNLLSVIENEGRYAEALPQRLQLLERTKASTEINPLTLASRYEDVGNSHRILGRFDEAKAMGEQALALIEKTQEPRSLSSVRALSHIGTALMLQGRYAQAEAAFRESLARVPQSTAPEACGMREYIGLVLRFEHRYAEAITELQALFKDDCLLHDKEGDVFLAMVLSTLSETQLDSGNVAAAGVSAEAAMAGARKAFPHPAGALARPLLALGRVKLALHQPVQAEPLLREALGLRQPPYPADHPRVLEVKVPLAIALEALGKHDEARALRTEIEVVLRASSSPHAADLLAQLGAQ
jgi:serine/threonine-protein kinase